MRISAVIVTVAQILIVVNCDNWVKNDEKSANNDGSKKRYQKLSTPEECARDCYEGGQPLTCYYKFTIEYYATLTQACTLCRSNSTTGLTPDCQCITADGYETSGIITANRQYPGPLIMVCMGDTVVVDVTNRVPGNAITIHWHGIFQKGYQYFDGVPFVTQCPILEGTTFRYEWKAQNSGTHFWHAHSGLHKVDGLEGPLIVREPRENDPNHKLWDTDLMEHFIFIGDWFHSSGEDHYPGTIVNNPGQFPDNFLINGKGQWTDPVSGNVTTSPLAVYTVKAGHRYRFRLINSCGLTCPVQMTIQGHNLTVVSSDGIYLQPVNVTSITSFSAERYDFVLHANQTEESYWMQFRGIGECAGMKLQQVAILKYTTAPAEPRLERPSYDLGLPAGIILNPLNVHCDGSPEAANVVCVDQLKGGNPTPLGIRRKEPDMRIFLPVDFYNFKPEEIFTVGTYHRFLMTRTPTVARMGNIANVFPSSPLISQRADVPDSLFCSVETAPTKCNGTDPCQCLHVEDIPLDAVVEFLLIDESLFADVSHPFHMHGHAFYIMGEARAEDFGIEKMTLDIAKKLHDKGLINRNHIDPPAKDTYAVPHNGIAVIRLIADNPGYWIFHCHFAYHLQIGMSLILHIGNHTDLPPVPKGFPKCGNFVPLGYDPEDSFS